MAATLDLRRDLPKVRKQWAKVLKAQKSHVCEYTAPCVIGAMINPRKRAALESAPFDDTQIGTLISEGYVKAPADQIGDIRSLQAAFDSNDFDHFERRLIEIEQRYGVEQ